VSKFCIEITGLAQHLSLINKLDKVFRVWLNKILVRCDFLHVTIFVIVVSFIK
jgi:hypothetical protein